MTKQLWTNKKYGKKKQFFTQRAKSGILTIVLFFQVGNNVYTDFYESYVDAKLDGWVKGDDMGKKKAAAKKSAKPSKK